MEILKIAKKMKKLENFVHISTCLVNGDKEGWIEEKIYKEDSDFEAIVKDVSKMSLNEVKNILF